MLIISVYMPCRGVRDNVNDFEDYLSQLQELVTKHQDTHAVLIGWGGGGGGFQRRFVKYPQV